MEWDKLFVALFCSYGLSCITILALGKSLIKRNNLFKTIYARIVLKVIIAIPFYFIINALFQSDIFFSIDFGDKYQSLPNYLILFATIITGYFVYQTLVAQQQTLVSQNAALKQQKSEFDGQVLANKISAFENRFFKFIDYHRENVALLKYRDPKTPGEKYWEGNQVFAVIYYEVKDLLETYLQNKYPKNEPTKHQKVAAINFIYQCVFFGKGKHAFPILQAKFNDSEFELINFSKRAAYYIDKRRHFYYTGHVRRLGHYFRNIYQAISYVEDQEFLSPKDKYEYVSTLRAQMSVYEQAVFFYNSISELGDVWEWKHYNAKYPDQDVKNEVFNKLWITKYDLIRNTINNDGEISKGINIKQFYPLLNLEREIEFEQFRVLPFRENTRSICRYCFNKKYIQYHHKNAVKEIKQMFSEYPNSIKCDEEDCETNKALIALY